MDFISESIRCRVEINNKLTEQTVRNISNNQKIIHRNISSKVKEIYPLFHQHKFNLFFSRVIQEINPIKNFCFIPKPNSIDFQISYKKQVDDKYHDYQFNRKHYDNISSCQTLSASRKGYTFPKADHKAQASLPTIIKKEYSPVKEKKQKKFILRAKSTDQIT